MIQVEGEDPVTIQVRATRHGPVLSDAGAARSNALTARAAKTVLALAWPALSEPNTTAEALYRVNRAGNWEDFVQALRFFTAPQQNIVYADVAGNIGFLAPALVPIRIGHDGRRPVPGWNRDRLWSGFIPFEALPRAFNPPRGRLVNANNRIVPENYPYQIALDWEAPYRAARIEALLDGEAALSPARAAAMQLDRVSLMARDLLPLMLAAAPGQGPAGGRPAEARALLGKWDGSMDRDQPEPLIFAAWMRELNRALYADELGALFAEAGHWRPAFVRWILSDGQAWCDDVTTAGIEDCASRIGLSLERALALLFARSGRPMAAWRWGDYHKLRFEHPLFRHVPLLRDWTSVEVETDGGNYTVNRGTPRLASEEGLFGHVHGAGLRAVFDLSDLDRSRFMIAFGQSGNPLSPLYGNLTQRWRDGDTLELAGDGKGVAGRLLLGPN